MNWINVPRYQFIFLFLGCQLGKLVDFLHHVRELVEEVEWIEQRKQQQQQTNNFCLANCKLLSSCNFVSPVWCTQMTLVGYDAVAAFVSFHFYSPGWKVLLGDTFGKSLVAIGTIIESSTEEETHACHDFFRRDGWLNPPDFTSYGASFFSNAMFHLCQLQGRKSECGSFPWCHGVHNVESRPCRRPCELQQNKKDGAARCGFRHACKNPVLMHSCGPRIFRSVSHACLDVLLQGS